MRFPILINRAVYSFLVCCFLIGCGQAEQGDPVPADGAGKSLGAVVSGLVQDNTMSGVVLVSRNGETILEQAFHVDALRADFEIDVDSVFAIASLTKSFTAPLVLQQVESGSIELDKPISAYLPEFDAAYSDEVTVRQLLQNRSGIPHYVDIPGWFEPEVKNSFTPESFLAELAKLELRFAPGEDYYYSNANYYFLGLILESATGESYEALLQETILKPLGLANTGQIYSPGSRNIAPTYLRDGDAYERIRISNPELFRATASQYSSAGDLAAFGQALMEGSVVSEQMRGVLLDEDRPMGFTVTSTPMAGEETDLITYNGELAGTTTMMTVFPEQDGTVVILSNNNTPYSTLVEMTLAIASVAFAGDSD